MHTMHILLSYPGARRAAVLDAGSHAAPPLPMCQHARTCTCLPMHAHTNSHSHSQKEHKDLSLSQQGKTTHKVLKFSRLLKAAAGKVPVRSLPDSSLQASRNRRSREGQGGEGEAQQHALFAILPLMMPSPGQ